MINQFRSTYETARLGAINLKMNDGRLSSEKAYFYILNKILWNDDIEAKKNEDRLASKPYGVLIWYIAYNYIVDMHKLLIWFNRSIAHKNMYPPLEYRDNICTDLPIFQLTNILSLNQGETTILSYKAGLAISVNNK